MARKKQQPTKPTNDDLWDDHCKRNLEFDTHPPINHTTTATPDPSLSTPPSMMQPRKDFDPHILVSTPPPLDSSLPPGALLPPGASLPPASHLPPTSHKGFSGTESNHYMFEKNDTTVGSALN